MRKQIICDFCSTIYPDDITEVGTGELYPGEFESRHYEFEEGDEDESTAIN